MWTSHPVISHTFPSLLLAKPCLGLPVLATAKNVRDLQGHVDGIKIFRKLETVYLRNYYESYLCNKHIESFHTKNVSGN